MTDQEKRAELYAREDREHEVQRKVEAGEFKRAWIGGIIVEAYGELWWIEQEDDKRLSVRVLLG